MTATTADRSRLDRLGRPLSCQDNVRRDPDWMPGQVTGFSAGRVEVLFADGVASRPYGHELVRCA